MSKRVIIVGGVAGGASTAARLRRLNEDAEIIMLERDEYISFANCGLPYYIGNVIEDRNKLLVQTPEAMRARFNIDVRVLNEVTEIRPRQHTVVVHDIAGDRFYEERYDKLVLSPGANPVKPPIPGIDSDRVFVIRNIPDTDRIQECIESRNAQTAVVIGGGFIGLEMAENLRHRGMQVSIVEMLDQVMPTLDREMAAIVHQHLRENGVQLHLEERVTGFRDGGNGIAVLLQGGEELNADFAVLSIGVRPNADLAAAAGLEIGPTGGIRVDEYLQTSDPDIYALGDAVQVRDFVSGEPALIPLAGPANKQGRIVADNIAGRRETYRGTQGTSILKVFDLIIATTGASSRSLENRGQRFLSSVIHSDCHAGYYPGARPVSIKLLFGEDGGLFGAQVVGYEGVDKRIDVLATALRYRKTVFDLQELELAYAPPFSSGKDPVNIAGYVA
ncbi:MAG: FAD-dependent oxidoreductase, partial [Bacillota bacterium]